MPRYYCVLATVVTNGKWRTCKQVPLFYINADVHGIISGTAAEEVARRIINPMGHDMEVHIHVEPVY